MRRIHPSVPTIAVFLLIGVGCYKPGSAPVSEEAAKHVRQAPSGKADGERGPEERRQDAKDKPAIERKIIYTAEVRLTVADFAAAEKELLQILAANKGIVAQTEVSGSAGSSQQAMWKLRIPVVRFNEFRDAVKKLGDLVRYTSDSQDVTDEYFDLQVRIKNKEDEIQTLRGIFNKTSGKVDEVLTVQRELSRATEELERMKGRQRVLENLTDLTTVTVYFQERGKYTPNEPTPFGTAVSNTFSGSVDVMVGLGKGIVLAGAALTPWLPAFAIVGAVGYFVRRRLRGRIPLVNAAPPPAK
jgi:hypothetical protein